MGGQQTEFARWWNENYVAAQFEDMTEYVKTREVARAAFTAGLEWRAKREAADCEFNRNDGIRAAQEAFIEPAIRILNNIISNSQSEVAQCERDFMTRGSAHAKIVDGGYKRIAQIMVETDSIMKQTGVFDPLANKQQATIQAGAQSKPERSTWKDEPREYEWGTDILTGERRLVPVSRK